MKKTFIAMAVASLGFAAPMANAQAAPPPAPTSLAGLGGGLAGTGAVAGLGAVVILGVVVSQSDSSATTTTN